MPRKKSITEQCHALMEAAGRARFNVAPLKVDNAIFVSIDPSKGRRLFAKQIDHPYGLEQVRVIDSLEPYVELNLSKSGLAQYTCSTVHAGLLQQYYAMHLMNQLLKPLLNRDIIPAHVFIGKSMERGLSLLTELTQDFLLPQEYRYWLVSEEVPHACHRLDKILLKEFDHVAPVAGYSLPCEFYGLSWQEVLEKAKVYPQLMRTIKMLNALGLTDVKPEHIFINPASESEEFYFIDLLLKPGALESKISSLDIYHFIEDAFAKIEEYVVNIPVPEFFKAKPSQHLSLIQATLRLMQSTSLCNQWLFNIKKGDSEQCIEILNQMIEQIKRSPVELDFNFHKFYQDNATDVDKSPELFGMICALSSMPTHIIKSDVFINEYMPLYQGFIDSVVALSPCGEMLDRLNELHDRMN